MATVHATDGRARHDRLAGPPPTAGDRARSRFPLAGLLLLTAALSAYRLGGYSLDFDEAVSATIARMPTGDFIHTLWQDEANMSLYYLLLRGWVAIGGSAEWWLRLPSVLASVATVGVLFLLGRRLVDRATGAVAGLLLALNGLFVQYAQEARSYALTALLVTLASYLFVRAAERGSGRFWVLYALVSALAVYGHLYAVLVPAAHALAVAVHPRVRALLPRLVAAWAATAVLVLPAARTALVRGSQQVYYNQPLSPRVLGQYASGFAGGGGPLLAAVIGLLCAVAVGAAVAAVLRRRGDDTTWRLALVALLLVVPPAGMIVTAAVEQLVQLRYFSLFVPFLALGAATGLTRLRGARARVAVLAMAVALSCVGLHHYFTGPVKEDSRAAIAMVQAQGRADDAVVLWDADRVMLWRYYAGDRGPRLAFPPRDRDPFPLYTSPLYLDAAAIREITATHPRVWYLSADDAVTGGPAAGQGALGQAFADTHALKERHRFFRVTVDLYARR
jgi:mannosyltransferase